MGARREPRSCPGHPRASPQPPAQALHVHTHGWEHFQSKSALLLSYFTPGATSAASAGSYTNRVASLLPCATPTRLQGPSLLKWVCQIRSPPHTPPAAVRGGGGRAWTPSTRTAAGARGGRGGRGGRRRSAVHGTARLAPSQPLQVCGKLRRPGGRRVLSRKIMVSCSGDTQDIQGWGCLSVPSSSQE